MQSPSVYFNKKQSMIPGDSPEYQEQEFHKHGKTHTWEISQWE